MGRKAALTPEAVACIKLDNRTLKEQAGFYGVSLLTIWKAKWGKPPYDKAPYVANENVAVD